MDQIIYSKELCPAQETDSGQPIMLYLTQETNGLALFIIFEGQPRLLRFFLQARRNEAVEAAVKMAEQPIESLLNCSAVV